jgi:Tol biopolymer transport system component
MNYSAVMQKASDPDSAAVRQELERIVASPVFEDSERLVRFLSFVVEETLGGRAGALKESVIGVEVFGRSAGYDPKADPIVRVQARRLRAKLELWYQAGGQTSTLRITLPKGGYAPEFAPPPSPAQSAAVPVAQKRRTAIWLIPIVGGIALVAVALVSSNRSAKPLALGSRLFTAYSGYQTSPAFSPDGLTLAFAWGGPEGDNVGIYVQPLDADTPRRLTSSHQRESRPVWLPDGRHIGFLRDDGPGQFAVMVAAVQGGGERQVAEIRGSPASVEWSRDGKLIYTTEPKTSGAPAEVIEIDLDSGSRRTLVPPVTNGPAAGTPGDDEVHLSPDGRWLAFRRRTATVVGDVFVVPVTGGAPRQVTHDRTGTTGFAWAKDGQSLIVSSQRESSLVRLWRFPIDGRPPVCLTDAALSASFPAVSPRDGQIAFASRFYDTNIWQVDLAGKSPPQRLIASNLLDSSPSYSPDGERIAFRSNRTGSDEIWTADAAGRSPVRLTDFAGSVTGSPHWSPDGQYLTFDSRPDGSADIFVVPAGGGKSARITHEQTNEVTPSFSRDGRSIYFASDRTGDWQIWKQARDGGPARQITRNGGFAPHESSDGHWLYYAKLNSAGLFRTPVAGGAESPVLETLPAGDWGGWGLSGRSVIYLTRTGKEGSYATELRTFDPETGAARSIANLPFPPVQWDGAIGISADGRNALVTVVERQGSEIHLQAYR